MIRTILPLLLLLPALAGAGSCPEEYGQIARKNVKENVFTDDRALGHYRMDLCCGFQKALDDLKPNDVILDVGSGRGVALAMIIRDYKPKNRLFGLLRRPQGKPVGIGVTVVRNEDRLVKKVLAENPDNLKFITGKFVEDIPKAELRNPKIITDFFGALSYTSEFDRVLQTYLDILRSDGKIFIFAGNKLKSTFEKDGLKMTMLEFLQTIPGLKVEVGMTDLSFAVSKGAGEVKVPKLRLKHIDTAVTPPPKRVFEVVD